jgi:hypothetical protein
MEKSEWRKMIAQHLTIKPLHHGQVYTEEIAIPEGKNKLIFPERKEDLTRSLKEYKSNLIPLILRRSDQYGDDYEYEVIYGEDWCIVAQELEIEKLWAWVFDLNEDQAEAIKAEMQQLAYLNQNDLLSNIVESNIVEVEKNQPKLIVDSPKIVNLGESPQSNKDKTDIILNQEKLETLIQSKSNEVLAKFNQYFEQLESINHKIDSLQANLLTKESVENLINTKITNIIPSQSSKNVDKHTPSQEKIKEKDSLDNDIDYNKLNITQLKNLARERKIPRFSRMIKQELILALQNN